MGRRISFLSLLLLTIVRAHAQVVINEIMYGPLAPEPEWIELFNAGRTDVALSGWSVQDASGVIASIPDLLLPSHGYLILTRDSVRFARVRTVPGAVVRIDLPALNNGGDLVWVRDRRGRLIDSVRYASSWGGTGGASLERHLPGDPSADRRSWRSSTSPARATPGLLNAITPVDHDLAVTSALFDIPSAGVSMIVLNNGLLAAPPAELRMSVDADGDEVIDEDEILLTLDVPALMPGDSVELSAVWPRPVTEEGETGEIGVRWPSDERSENDQLLFEASSVPPGGGTVINEIMYDPVALDGEPGAEYVELYNPSRRHIALLDWRLYDGTGRAQGTVREIAAVPPRGLLVLATDSALFRRFPALVDSDNVLIIGPSSFALNVEGDQVVLRRGSGETVDSVPYLDSWHRSELASTKGIALERISVTGSSTDRRNWSSSTAPLGGTPAAWNSVAIVPSARRATLDVGRGVVSPDGDGIEDFLRISFRLPAVASLLVVTVYDRQGRPMRRLAGNELVGSEGEVIWDGCADDGRPLSPGIYVVHLEAYDADRGGTVTADAPAIVARRLGD
jgi:hypothetical protein